MKLFALALAITLTQAVLAPAMASAAACPTTRETQVEARERAERAAAARLADEARAAATKTAQDCDEQRRRGAARDPACRCENAEPPAPRGGLAVRAPDARLMGARGVL